VAVSNPQNKIKIKELARLQYENLKRFVATLKLESFAIEPTFISPVYGLQGRLDLLAEYHLSPNRKDIYELKSGNPAKLNQFFQKDGSIISTGVYVNHFAQVTVYNMLLDTCYPNRKGNSAIIYSKDGENPIRNVPNYYKMKQEIILARNQYLAFEQELLNNSNSFFDNEWERNFEHSPSWIKNDFNLLKNMFNNANSLISEYYTVQLKFVLDELYTMKLGENSHYSGFSEIWKESIKEKKLKSRIMTELTLVEEESDFDNLHLTFTFPADDNMNVSFRKGDIAILYPDDNNSEFTPQRGRLIKCSIKEITRNKLIVSIRNKLEHGYFASNNTKWILDFDNTDSLQKSILHSLSAFLTTNEEKQNILLGLTRPEFNFDEYDLPDYLSAEQKSILMRILNSQDYFLLQGPPGTGKTKYMLAALVETLINQTNDNILVLAYTNRAVDEICSALKSLNGIFNKPFDIVRLGRKDNTIHKDIVLSHIVENNDINLVYKELKKTRVFAATVATIVTNTQLLDFKYFHTAIIDEASQITEANLIGILAKVERFVLIGDEKQLPAIVLQSKKHKDAPSENMSKIHFILPETSLFERLLDCAKSNAWYDAFAMLTRQARMHADIMEFPAQYFYNNQLKIFDYDLQMSKIDWHFNMEDFLAKELNMHRFIFINTDIEVHSKYNIAEVNAVVDIIKTIIGKSDNKDDSIVGVISPFRLQCSLIQKKLPDNLNAIVTVDTVEKFQGSQREFIVISMALNNIYLLDKTQSSTIIDGQEIDRKLNVAITRAKSHVVILGNSQILSHSPVYSRLIEHCKSKNAFLDLDSLHLSYF
jgi:DNA replication ATP-dependent helicase Dna2